MSNEVQDQSAGYNLADLKPVLENMQDNNALLDSMPIWLSAQTAKSAGRGRSADNTHQYGVQKLRELILELAVRGKLVEQDSNDEPASVLLEKIAKEKARLVQEGKIKK
jgi:type I restriction enzyme S subunit